MLENQNIKELKLDGWQLTNSTARHEEENKGNGTVLLEGTDYIYTPSATKIYRSFRWAILSTTQFSPQVRVRVNCLIKTLL